MEIKKLQMQNNVHWNDIGILMNLSIKDLKLRAVNHDYTRFGTIGEDILLKALNTGNFSYWEKYHFAQEDHHIEHYKNKIDISLEALLEMVMDEAASQYRRSPKKQTFDDQYEFFVERKGWNHEMATILANQFMKYYKALEEKCGEK